MLMTIRRGKNASETVAEVREETRRQLERLGRERALIYKTLVLTGLRKGELASITVGQVVLDANLPYLILDAADEKNREGSTIPLRADLADDLWAWLADKATALQEAARRAPSVRFDPEVQKHQKLNQSDSTQREGHSCQALTTLPTLPADTPLFTVPTGLVRILDHDLVAAGIARRVEVSPGKWKIDKLDERGRTVDVHALRHTFGTLLSKGGVSPRTTQAAMRHPKIDLTMNTYTDPKLLDVAGAMDVLPALPLVDAGTESISARNVLEATGTDGPGSQSGMGAGARLSRFAPGFAPTPGKTGTLGSILDKITTHGENDEKLETISISVCPVKRKDSLTTVDNESSEWAMRDSNPRHPRCKRVGSATEPPAQQDVTSPPSEACTSACTSEPENVNAEALAAIWPYLSEATRAKIIAAIQEAAANSNADFRGEVPGLPGSQGNAGSSGMKGQEGSRSFP